MLYKITPILLISMLTLTACSENADPAQSSVELQKVNDQSQVDQLDTPAYQEGVHYRIVNNINTGDLKDPSIIEYFWLSCGHCQKLEQPLKQFKAEHPNVGFARKHAVLGENWVRDGRLYYALEETGNMQHFDEFFSLYMTGLSEETFIEFFNKNAIDQAQFLEVAGSSDNVLAKMQESLSEMSENKITSVPSLVINGKYLILSAEDTRTNESFFKLVDYLLTK